MEGMGIIIRRSFKRLVDLVIKLKWLWIFVVEGRMYIV